MQRKALLGFLLLAVNSGVLAAAADHYLPQIVNGRSGGVLMRTTFLLVNKRTLPVPLTLSLTADDGLPLALTMVGAGSSSTFRLTLGPAQTRILRTDGSGGLRTGAAVLSAGDGVDVSVVFSVIPEGRSGSETGVGAAPPLSAFYVPVDAAGSSSVGVALLNPGGQASEVRFRLIDRQGSEAGVQERRLEAGHHMAIFVTGAGQLFPGFSDFQGILSVMSTQPLSAITLKQYADPISYTSFPVISASAAANEFTFAHLAIGRSLTERYRTSFLVFNAGSSAAHVSLDLTRDDGSPLTASLPGAVGAGGRFWLPEIPALGSVLLETGDDGPVQSGAARLISDAPVGAAAVVRLSDGFGNRAAESGIPSCPALSQLTIPVDSGPNLGTGVAFFNAGPEAALLRVRLFNELGLEQTAVSALTLPAGSHVARYVTELFPGAIGSRGSLAIESSFPIAAAALRLGLSPAVLTTLPIAAGAAVKWPGYWPTNGWRTSLPEEQGIDSQILVAGGEYVRTQFPMCYSVSVVRHGRLVFERYYNGVQPGDATNIMSVTKSVLSALTGIALEQKILQGVDQPIADYYPEYFTPALDPGKREIRIRHLLTMTAGLEWQEWGSVFYQWLQSRDFLRFAIELPLVSAPGGQFNYNTALTHLQSGILTRASGLTTLEFGRRNLFDPLGFTRFQWMTDPQGYNIGGAELYLTPRDMAKFGYLFLEQGYWEDRQLVPAAWVRESTSIKVADPNQTGFTDYGYLWWLGWIQGQWYFRAAGHGGQSIFIFPDLDMVVVLTARSDVTTEQNSVNYSRTFTYLREYVLKAVDPEW